MTESNDTADTDEFVTALELHKLAADDDVDELPTTIAGP